MKNKIKEIRALLSEGKKVEAFEEMVSLNIFNPDTDDYMQYFTSSYDLIDENMEHEELVLVEDVYGDFVEAGIGDLLDTLEEIEAKFC